MATGTNRGDFASNGDLTAVPAMPGGDAVAPPQLARDAPVPDVLHPLEEDDLAIIRDKSDAAASHGIHGLFRQGLGSDKPLIRDERFNDVFAAIAFAEADLIGLDLFEESFCFESRDDSLPGLEPVEAGILARRRSHPGVFADHLHRRQTVSLPCLEVVGIMRRGNLHNTCSELRISHVVGYDWDLSTDKRQTDSCAVQVGVSFVIRVDHNGRVAEHGFRTSGRHGQMTFAIRKWVTNVPEMPVDCLVYGFHIRDGRLATRAPIDHVLTAIDESLFPE